jgi:hypothetical protein
LEKYQWKKPTEDSIQLAEIAASQRGGREQEEVGKNVKVQKGNIPPKP